MLKALAILVIIATDLLMVPVQGQGDALIDKTYVRVSNDLGGNINLLVHCRSKDSDLGVHQIGNRQYIDWTFRDNIIGTTLYWCNMKWNQIDRSFQIYSTHADRRYCMLMCWRSVRLDGVYFYHEYDGVYVKQISW